MRIVLGSLVLLSVACSGSTEPPANLSGQWAARFALPGSAFQFTLTQAAESLHGFGSYAIEAGRSGTLSVRGAYSRPSVELLFSYDYGAQQLFAGDVAGSTMSGAMGDSLEHKIPWTFYRH